MNEQDRIERAARGIEPSSPVEVDHDKIAQRTLEITLDVVYVIIGVIAGVFILRALWIIGEMSGAGL